MSRTAHLLVGKTAPTCLGLAKKERKKRSLSCMSFFMLKLPPPAEENHLTMQFAASQIHLLNPPPYVA
jgi:hypothetical protein